MGARARSIAKVVASAKMLPNTEFLIFLKSENTFGMGKHWPIFEFSENVTFHKTNGRREHFLARKLMGTEKPYKCDLPDLLHLTRHTYERVPHTT